MPPTMRQAHAAHPCFIHNGDRPVRDSPLVSVIVATYNCGAFVGEAIQSALGQTYSPVEVIVVDDGSTDNTAEVLDAFGKAITVIQQDNAGASAARNAAIREARGEFVAVLDADDVWLPDKLDVQMPLFGLEPQIDLVFAKGTVMDETGQYLSRVCPEAFPAEVELRRLMDGGYVLEGDWFTGLARVNFIGHSSIVARLSAVRAVGGYDEDLSNAEDYHLYCRLAARGCKIGFLDRVVCRFRRRTGSLSWDGAVHKERRKLALKKLLDGPWPLPASVRRELRRSLASLPKTAADQAFCDGDLRTARRLYVEAFRYFARPAQIASWGATWLGPFAREVLKLINRGTGVFDELPSTGADGSEQADDRHKGVGDER